MTVAGPVATPHHSIISTGNKHLAGWHANLAFNRYIVFMFASFEPRHEKTSVLVFDLLRHKPGCTATENG